MAATDERHRLASNESRIRYLKSGKRCLRFRISGIKLEDTKNTHNVRPRRNTMDAGGGYSLLKEEEQVFLTAEIHRNINYTPREIALNFASDPLFHRTKTDTIFDNLAVIIPAIYFEERTKQEKIDREAVIDLITKTLLVKMDCPTQPENYVVPAGPLQWLR